ncbi:MAG: hypothetical protein JO033_15985 [Acidobacteriaceae bacterium]|nr:hypothetical protein [Acidobacteriaceae bacterium]MBV9501792.1 hypothetical protein [Acidobacteriaceae bacterium]
MDFCFFRAGRPKSAAGILAVLTGLVLIPFASGQQPAGGQQPAAGQQPGATTQKNWKDRAEYDLYVKMSQTQDPKARLELLNTWSDKYPQTDYNQERLVYYVNTLAQLAPTDPSARQQLLQKCQDLLKIDPNNFQAMYFTSLWGPAVGGASPSADVSGQVETAANGVLSNIDKAFDPSKKPATVSEADFTKAKGQAQAVAHNALAWVDSAKKDTAGAEEQYKDSLQANPDQGNISALYAKLLYDDKKFPDALFEYARAAEYAGPGPSLPAATRQQLTDFFNKAYKDFHGNPEGADQVLSQAKANALPPSGYSVTSQVDLANKEAADLQSRINSDPAFKLWYSIQQGLTGSGGDQFFTNNVKDAEIPGGAEGVKNFTGTVISIDPPDRPTKVVLGVQSPTTPDATLAFSQPLPASALDKIKVGQKLDFSGVADSYTANPYMLTFKDPSIPGVQTAAPPRTGTHRPRHR